MFDRPIVVLRYRDSRDEYGDRSKELVPVATLVAQRTESGGRENLYAGRIVHENEVAYTIRYRSGIELNTFVIFDDAMILQTHMVKTYEFQKIANAVGLLRCKTGFACKTALL